MRFATRAAFLAGVFLTAIAATRGVASDTRPRFRSEAGQFSVESAETPKEQERDVPSPAGPLKSHLFVFHTGRKAKMISYFDRPTPAETASEKVAVLNGARDGFVTSVKGTLVSEKEVTCRDYPGRELLVETASGIRMRVRTYLAKRRLYSIVVGAPKPEFPEQEAAAFLQSFTITH